jgi:Uma2 family endonuclease
MKTSLPIRRWTSDDFDKMMEHGLLAPRGYELIDGIVYNTQGFVKRWSVYDLDRLAESGVITATERAELIEGAVFKPRGIRPIHSYVRMLLNRLLFEATREDDSVIVSPTGYLLLDDETLVAPESFVMTMAAHSKSDEWPGANDVSLVTEIAGPLFTVLIDLKRPIYARHKIPELWIIDPDRGLITVHATPADGDYRDVRVYRRGDVWRSAALRGATVRVEDAVGPER